MKILLIDNSPGPTGASKALLKHISEISSRSKDDFIFLYPQGSTCVPAVQAAGYRAYELPMREISKRPADVLLYFPNLVLRGAELKKIIRREKVSIVHVNDMYNMIGLFVKLITGVKVITHVRRMPESFPASIYRTWSKLHVRYADHIIAVSEANRNGFPPNDKTTIIYDPLPDEEELLRYEPRSRLEKRLKILYLANYTMGKGHLHAIHLMARAVKQFPDWTFELHFYGGDLNMEKNASYKEFLISSSQEQGLASITQFHGPARDIEQVMKAHDLVFNLSDSESFSRVTLEALFFGVPIIATDVGGTREMVLHGGTGLLCKAKDIDSMLASFSQMIGDDAARCRMAASGWQFVRRQFRTEDAAERLAAIYEKLDIYK